MTPASTPDAGFQQPFWPTPATMSLVDHLAPWLAVHPLHSPPELTFDFFRISNAHGSVVNALMALQSPQSAMDFWDFILSFQCFCILVVSVGFCAFFYLFVCGGHCRPWGRDLVMRVWRATLSIQCRAQSLDAHSGSSPLPFLTTEKVPLLPIPKGGNAFSVCSHFRSRCFLFHDFPCTVARHFGTLLAV